MMFVVRVLKNQVDWRVNPGLCFTNSTSFIFRFRFYRKVEISGASIDSVSTSCVK